MKQQSALWFCFADVEEQTVICATLQDFSRPPDMNSHYVPGNQKCYGLASATVDHFRQHDNTKTVLSRIFILGTITEG